MRWSPARTAALAMLAVVFATPFGAVAGSCVPHFERETTLDVDLGVKRYYVDTVCFPTCMDGGTDLILHEETNGIDRLQRHDDREDDTCGLFPGDTELIF